MLEKKKKLCPKHNYIFTSGYLLLIRHWLRELGTREHVIEDCFIVRCANTRAPFYLYTIVWQVICSNFSGKFFCVFLFVRMEQPKVLILGHSVIRRLRDFIIRNRPTSWRKLPLGCQSYRYAHGGVVRG